MTVTRYGRVVKKPAIFDPTECDANGNPIKLPDDFSDDDDADYDGLTSDFSDEEESEDDSDYESSFIDDSEEESTPEALEQDENLQDSQAPREDQEEQPDLLCDTQSQQQL